MNGLKISDYLAVFLLLLAVFLLIRQGKEKRREFLTFFLTELKKPGTIMAIVILVAVPALTAGKTVIWWDDFNFWATDVKSIFYLNGFRARPALRRGAGIRGLSSRNADDEMVVPSYASFGI